MKTLRNFFATATTGLLLTGLALSFNACTGEGPFQPRDNNSTNSVTALAKGKPAQEDEYNYPLSTDLTFLRNSKGQFQGGQLKVANGTTFSFRSGSLTSPSGWTDDRIILTMEVDRDPVKNELLFKFGPSGCQFNPSATVWFNYGDLGISAPKLYYIDSSGNYVEQAPDYVDYRGNKMLLKIDHFSRYAIAAN